MLSYLKKFAMDILPSVVATIIGAYVVNHYIVAKPGAEAPVAAAVSSAEPKATGKGGSKAETAEVGNLPAAGVRARGISEKAILKGNAADRPAVAEKPPEKASAKADVKPAEAPVKVASIPAEPRRHHVAPREKIRVVLPSPVQPVAPAEAPVAAAPNPAPPVEAAIAPETHPEAHRDANDLARAAIERLRVKDEKTPRAHEAARMPEAPRIAPALRPLPPPIMVSTPPAGEQNGQDLPQPRPPYVADAGIGDQTCPTPPADIPFSRPLDLRAGMAEPSMRERTTAVAEDVLLTAKTLFNAVLPK